MSTPLVISYDNTGPTEVTNLIAAEALWLSTQGADNSITLKASGSIICMIDSVPEFQIDTNIITANSKLKLASFTVADLLLGVPFPDAGAVVYASDARGSSLTGSLCFGNGTDWIDVTTGNIVTD